MRKMRDSNPRYEKNRTADFESAPIGHSGNLPSNSGCKSTSFYLYLQEISPFLWDVDFISYFCN